jgi:quinol monooxygenase YgiN
MLFRLWLCVILLAFGVARAEAQTPPPATAPQPPPTGPVYVITYFEVAPASSGQTAAALRQFAATSRKETGNVEFTVLREMERGGRYAVIEAWQDKAALDAHGAAMKALGEKLQPNFLSPFDARQFWGLALAPPTAANANGAIMVLTHVDVFPAGKDQVAALVKQQVADSRKDSGDLRFDALIQDQRPNHFHLIEAWNGRASRDNHALAQHSREFRAKLVPFEGALYDERLFEVVR